MTIRAVTTQMGIVVREFFPSGERAYRRHWDGVWDYSPDHKNFWVSVRDEDVPERFKEAASKYGLNLRLAESFDQRCQRKLETQ